MVGSDYAPDVSEFYPVFADTPDGGTPAGDPNEPGLNPPPQKSFLKRLAESLVGPSKGQGQQQQTQEGQQEKAQTAQQQAQQTTKSPGAGSAAAGAAYQAGPKSTQWATSDPAAIGKASHAQRQADAYAQIGHMVGQLVRMAATYGAGGAAVPAETGAGAATSIPAGSTETFTPGGGDTGLVSGGGGGGLSSLLGGGGGGGGGIQALAKNYMGGSGGGGDYSGILKLLQGGGGGGGGGLGGGGGGLGGGLGGMGSAAGKWNQEAQQNLLDVAGVTGRKTKALAELEGLTSGGLTSTGGLPGGGSDIPWAV